MKKALAVAAILLTFSSSAFAAPPPGVSSSHPHHSHISSSHRVHVGPSHHMHTPTGNRVRMTPTHGQTGPVGGRMSSMHHGYRHSSVHVGPRVYVRPSLPPPPRWRYACYYVRPYGYRAVWYGYPVPYYYRYPYGVYYRRYYASPGIHISVRL